MRIVLVSMFSCIALLLAGCMENVSQMGFSSNSTPEERELEKEAKSLTQVTRSIVTKNTVEGAVIGAAAGCGLMLLFGGDGGDCAAGAVAGGVVGGVGGNQVGRQAAAANEELVKQDQIIANLKGINERLSGVQTRLRSVVRSQNAEINSLRRQLQNDQISESAYNSRVRAINANRQNVMNSLARSEQNVVSSRNELVSLEQQGGTRLTASKNAATRTQRRLASLRSSIRLVSTD